MSFTLEAFKSNLLTENKKEPPDIPEFAQVRARQLRLKIQGEKGTKQKVVIGTGAVNLSRGSPGALLSYLGSNSPFCHCSTTHTDNRGQIQDQVAKRRRDLQEWCFALRVHVINKQLSQKLGRLSAQHQWWVQYPQRTSWPQNFNISTAQSRPKKKIKMLFIISTSCLILVQKKSTILWKATFKKRGGNKDHPNLSLQLHHTRDLTSLCHSFCSQASKRTNVSDMSSSA